MATRRRLLSLALLLVTLSSPASAQNPTLRAAMREKLANAQGMLAAVIEGNYPAIVRQADRLTWISETEIASWQTSAEPEYVRQATVFLLSVQGLREAATSRDVEGVTREFGTLVSSCIRCHSTLRNAARASLDSSEMTGLEAIARVMHPSHARESR